MFSSLQRLTALRMPAGRGASAGPAGSAQHTMPPSNMSHDPSFASATWPSEARKEYYCVARDIVGCQHKTPEYSLGKRHAEECSYLQAQFPNNKDRVDRWHVYNGIGYTGLGLRQYKCPLKGCPKHYATTKSAREHLTNESEHAQRANIKDVATIYSMTTRNCAKFKIDPAQFNVCAEHDQACLQHFQGKANLLQDAIHVGGFVIDSSRARWLVAAGYRVSFDAKRRLLPWHPNVQGQEVSQYYPNNGPGPNVSNPGPPLHMPGSQAYYLQGPAILPQPSTHSNIPQVLSGVVPGNASGYAVSQFHHAPSQSGANLGPLLGQSMFSSPFAQGNPPDSYHHDIPMGLLPPNFVPDPQYNSSSYGQYSEASAPTLGLQPGAFGDASGESNFQYYPAPAQFHGYNAQQPVQQSGPPTEERPFPPVPSEHILRSQ